jgi:Protein of unknown function (DUF3667)
VAEAAQPAAPVEPCPNCGAVLAGPFCAECGQRRPAPDDYSPQRFWRHVFHEATEVDSSLVRSLIGLFRPGFLTREHLAGRRGRYLSPVKLYLLVSAVYFLFAWDASFEMMNYAEQLRNDPNLAAAMPSEMGQKYLAGLDEIIERSGEYTGYLRFVTVLGLGFVLALLYRRQGRALGQHFVFTLHFYSFYLVFALLVLAALLLWRAVTGVTASTWLYFVIGYLPVAPFAYAALRRVYGQSRRKTALKTALLMLFDAAMWMTVGILAFGVATFQVLRS